MNKLAIITGFLGAVKNRCPYWCDGSNHCTVLNTGK